MSESSKPTPGPWKAIAQTYDSSAYYIFAAGAPDKRSPMVAHIPRSTVQPMEANARLIAASPELLGEIESTYEWLADIHHNWPGRHTLTGQARLIRLRDLIAKATGRDPEEVQDRYSTSAALANTERKTS